MSSDQVEINLEKKIFDDIKTDTEKSPKMTEVAEKQKSSLCNAPIVALCLAVIALSAVAIMEYRWNKGAKGNDSNLCLTDACINSASQISSRMNRKVDPCEDFYEYSCGQWNDLNPIPERLSRYTTYGKMSIQVRHHVKNILEEPVKEKETINKAKEYYTSCMNEELLSKRGFSPLTSLIKEFKGGWPIINKQWNQASFDLEEHMATVNKYGKDVIWERWVGTDLFKRDQHIFKFEQGTAEFDSYKYTDSRFKLDVEALKTFISDVAVVMGADEKSATEDAEAIVKFETELAKIHIPSKGRHMSKSYKNMKLSEMDNKYEGVNWTKYVGLVLKSINHKVDDDMVVGNFADSFFEKLGDVLKETEERTIANYIIWRLVHTSVFHVSSDVFGDAIDKYHGVVGSGRHYPRWEYCTRYTNSFFTQLVGRQFINRFFDPDMKKWILKMISKLSYQYKETIKSNKWIDEETKNKAIIKIDKLKHSIGYDDRILNDEFLFNMYREYTPNKETFFENILNVWKVDEIDTNAVLDKPVSNERRMIKPTTVNAYHSSHSNQIIFPAGIIQPPLYSKDYLDSQNFGGIGVVIGHEITHGFDNYGRHFDENGSTKYKWPKKISAEFVKRAMCYARQYSKFEVNGLHLNGNNTMNENISDNGGILESFNAYRSLVTDENKDLQLPILKASNDKLFYIGFGQVWCGKIRKSAWKHKLTESVHSPGIFRVLGTIQNSVEFAKAFGCKKDTYMNPSHKCKIW